VGKLAKSNQLKMSQEKPNKTTEPTKEKPNEKKVVKEEIQPRGPFSDFRQAAHESPFLPPADISWTGGGLAEPGC
jgi:hypothetical protein